MDSAPTSAEVAVQLAAFSAACCLLSSWYDPARTQSNTGNCQHGQKNSIIPALAVVAAKGGGATLGFYNLVVLSGTAMQHCGLTVILQSRPRACRRLYEL